MAQLLPIPNCRLLILMIYCLNPQCQNPQNTDNVQFCLTCGTRLNLKKRYRAIALLGEGGFGRTFVAEDIDRLNAPCVIKQFLPLPQVQQKRGLLEKAMELFAQEAQQLLQLGDFPQIPTLFADFEEDGYLYLIQEFIDGQNLLEELEARRDSGESHPYSGKDIEEILLDILPVLEYIHSRGVIHRDIKPENIIRRQSDGKLVLIDFGVAKQLSGSVLIKTGTKIGTEGYAAIEQLRGGKAFPASDLYSLGVTCIHLLTGIEPDKLYDPMNGRWLWREELSKKGIEIAAVLGGVIDKLVREWVSDRYQSASDAKADLLKTLPLQFATGKGETLTTIQTGADPQVYGRQGGRQRGQQGGNANSSSAIATPWKCVHTLTGHSNYVIGVAISSDNQTLVSCSYDKTIKLWHVGSGNLLGTLTGHSRWVSCIAISPNGQILASGSLDSSINLWHIGTGNLLREISDLPGYPICLAINSSGTILAAGCFDHTIRLWDLDSGKPIGQLVGHASYIESVAFSPSGNVLASGGSFDDRTIRLWNVENLDLVAVLKGHNASIRSLTFSSDGRQVVSCSEDKSIKVWDASAGKIIDSFPKQNAWLQAIAMSPSGDILASGSRDSTINLWQFPTGQILYTLKWHSGAVTSLVFSADGNTLASSSWDKTIKIWQVE